MRVGLVGKADFDNFGDVLIFGIYVRELAKHGVQPLIFRASKVFVARLKQLGMQFGSTSDVDHFCDSVDVAMFIGGGYLGAPDRTDILWQWKWFKDRYFEEAARGLTRRGRRYVLEGVELGPGLRPFVHRPVGALLKNARSIAVRNPSSLSYLRKNWPMLPAMMIPDVVLSLAHTTGDVLSSTLQENRHPASQTGDGRLAVHITGKTFGGNRFAFRFRQALLRYVAEEQLRVLLLSDQAIREPHRPIIEAFHEDVNRLGGIVDVYEYDGVLATLGALHPQDRLITTKLHLGVVGLLKGADVLCLSSHPKLERFYRDFDLSDRYVDYFRDMTFGRCRGVSAWLREKRTGSILSRDASQAASEYLTRVGELVRGTELSVGNAQ